MGFFEKIFARARLPTGAMGYFKQLNGYTPIFTSWNGQLYESELVRAAIDAKARHVSKLQVHMDGAAKPTLRTKLNLRPNEFQTWGQFLYRVSTILDMQNTVFLVKTTDDMMRPTGVFPLLPSQCEVREYQGEAWLRYHFRNGETAAVPLAETGILTRHQYKDDLFGEKNTALKSTMELIHLQVQGIMEAVKNSNTFRFMAKLSNFSKADDLAKESRRFNRENLQEDGGGMLLFPNTYTDIKQVMSTPYVVNAEQQKQIQTNVFNYFGVNEKILQNMASGDEWAAFYEGCIEVFSTQLSDVLTDMFFSDREQTAGARIFLTANRLQYMSNKDKLAVSAQMGDRGTFMIDEVREIWNLPPLPDGQGRKFTLRGEYYLRGEDGSITRYGTEKGEENAGEQ